LVLLAAKAARRSIDAHFIEGHELPADVATRAPERMVGRLLRANEAQELLDTMARWGSR
jgi:hypothetical protein